jgi:hypothetical protein
MPQVKTNAFCGELKNNLIDHDNDKDNVIEEEEKDKEDTKKNVLDNKFID